MQIVHNASKPLSMDELRRGSALCCPPEPLRMWAPTPSSAVIVLVVNMCLMMCGSSWASPRPNGFQAMFEHIMQSVPRTHNACNRCFKRIHRCDTVQIRVTGADRAHCFQAALHERVEGGVDIVLTARALADAGAHTKPNGKCPDVYMFLMVCVANP